MSKENVRGMHDELISKKAAIDALRTCYDTETITMDNGDEFINYGDAVGEIEQLPPIQPEPYRIPVTKNCDCDLMDNEEVLVFQKGGTINGQIRHAMFYDFNGKKKFVTWEEGITIYNVLAYMPLPEPYKGVTE